MATVNFYSKEQIDEKIPDTAGASQGDVLTVGASGTEWATPSGGGGKTIEVIDTTEKFWDAILNAEIGDEIISRAGSGTNFSIKNNTDVTLRDFKHGMVLICTNKYVAANMTTYIYYKIVGSFGTRNLGIAWDGMFGFSYDGTDLKMIEDGSTCLYNGSITTASDLTTVNVTSLVINPNDRTWHWC